MDNSWIKLLFWFSWVILSQAADSKLSIEECLKLGYRSVDLFCSRCEELTKFKLASFKKSCLRCCNENEKNPSNLKFKKARLEICKCNIDNYPAISAFIEENTGFKLKYVTNLQPMIRTVRTDGSVTTLNIENWTTDHIVDFFKNVI